jgi:PAS domain S-box-containing protein
MDSVRRILVVEDNLPQAQVLSMLLSEIGMEVVLAHDLNSAFQVTATSHIDIVMLDLTLPDGNGLEVVTRFVQHCPLLPVVVMTAMEGTALSSGAMQCGAEDYLVKGEVKLEDVERSLRYAVERKKQSNRLYESEQRLRKTIDNSYNAFLAFDSDLTLIEWNARAKELFGYTAAEVIGKKICDKILLDCSDGCISEELTKAVVARSSKLLDCRNELMAIRRGGTKFPVEVAFFLVEEGGKYTLCTFVTDISDRKAFEEHAAQFYSLVAHELKTPLASIKGVLSLMRADMLSAEEKNQLLVAGIDSCERLVLLINDLLELSKFEAGQMPLNKVECMSSVLVARAVSECSGMAKEKAVTIVVQETADYSMSIDIVRIIQVLVNLLSNALKYSPANSLVTVTTELTSENRVRFSISDQGAGISPQGIRKLFQKFQQVQEDAKVQKDGTGLGLAISKAIVEHHMGDIGVCSKLSEGTTFWFEIPLQS